VVRDEVVSAAREQIGQMPIAVSVIALGQENQALRRLVARQRSQGERAFYHFVDDESLSQLCSGELGSLRALHLPDVNADDDASSDVLDDELADVLDELAELDNQRHRWLLAGQRGDELERAYAELGLELDQASEGQRALREAAERDRRAVAKRYRRWFPIPDAKPDAPPLSDEQHSDVDAGVVLLSTIAEVTGELAGNEVSRQADAIDLLERLLPDSRMSPARYEAVVALGAEELNRALEAVHAATRPAGELP
jgi:hypothetical protein